MSSGLIYEEKGEYIYIFGEVFSVHNSCNKHGENWELTGVIEADAAGE